MFVNEPDVADNHIGEKYNQLTIIGNAGIKTISGKPRYMAVCQCECGKQTVKRLNHIIHGYVKSCGCLRSGRPNLTNTYEIKEDMVVVGANNGKYFLIDLEDLPKIKNDYYHITKDGYVRNTKGVLVHALIMNCPKDKVVDHINHNTVDNRKFNLRICTRNENAKNRKNPGGVLKTKSNKWRAYISVESKILNLGTYANKEDAIAVRKQAEIKYYGDFRNKEALA